MPPARRYSHTVDVPSEVRASPVRSQRSEEMTIEPLRRAVSLMLIAAAISCVAALPAAAQTGLTPPILIAPSGTLSEAAPEFSWRAVAGATYYQLWIDDSTGNRLQSWYTASALSCGSAICRVRPGVEPAGGVGTWWVRSWNAAGYGPWSSGMSFSRVPPPAAFEVVPSICRLPRSRPRCHSPKQLGLRGLAS